MNDAAERDTYALKLNYGGVVKDPLTERTWLFNNNMNGDDMLSTHDYVGDISDEQKVYCEKIREAFKLVESVLLEHPATKEMNFSSRCFALARTHLEESCMFAIKGTVFDGKDVYGYGSNS